MTLAFVFPGQGSQRVGMGADLAGRWPDSTREFFRAADDVVCGPHPPLSQLCAQGPAEALRETAIAQPAIFTTSMTVLRILRNHGVLPDVVAGHSLGEYSALASAGALEWRDALKLVRVRGQLMETVNARMPGAMQAILGMDLVTLEGICAQVSASTGKVVEVANDNDPGQLVISGAVDAVAAVAERALAAGATRAVPLATSAPFHCSLMSVIEDEFAAEVAKVRITAPRVRVISSVTGEPMESADQVRDCLVRQLAGRVRWTETVGNLVRSGVTDVIEVGPGRVLGGLVRRCAPELSRYSTDTPELIDKVLDVFGPTCLAADLAS